MSDLIPTTPPAIVIQSPTGQRLLGELAEEVRGLVRRTGEATLRIGQALVEAQEIVGTNRFAAWLALEVPGMSRTSAYRFMQVAKAFSSKRAELGEGFEASALYLLAAGDVPEEARDEALELAAAGTPVTRAKAKELVAKHAAPSEEDDDDADPEEPAEAHQPAHTADAGSSGPSDDDAAARAAGNEGLRTLGRALAEVAAPGIGGALVDDLVEERETADDLRARVAELEAELAAAKGPSAHTSATSTEYGTPDDVLEDARYVLGRIDLDPFSCAKANARVKASAWWGKDDNGLTKEWHGNVLLNPPGAGGVGPALDHLWGELAAGRTTAAFVVVFNAHTGRSWFEQLWGHLGAFPRRPIAYLADHETIAAAPPHASAFFLVGGDVDQQRRFVERMRARGAKVVPPDAWIGELPPAGDLRDPVARLRAALELAVGAIEDAEAEGYELTALEEHVDAARALLRELGEDDER